MTKEESAVLFAEASLEMKSLYEVRGQDIKPLVEIWEKVDTYLAGYKAARDTPEAVEIAQQIHGMIIGSPSSPQS